MSKIIETTAQELSHTYEEAISLHQQIVESGNAAAASLFEMARCLKRMRDLKLYTELNFTSFDDYVEQMVGIKKRQAYNYISTYERFGETFLKEHGNLGITKLSLLAQIPATELDEFMEENPPEKSSASRIKELVDEMKNQGEQISFLQEENEQLKAEKSEETDNTAEITALQEKIALLEKEKSAPPQVDEKELQKIRKTAEKEAKAKAKADIEKAKQAAEEKAKKAETDAAEKIKKLEQEKAKLARRVQIAAEVQSAAEDRAKKAEKELQLKSSAATSEFMIHLEYLKESYNKLVTLMMTESKQSHENGQKLGKALQKMLSQMIPPVNNFVEGD